MAAKKARRRKSSNKTTAVATRSGNNQFALPSDLQDEFSKYVNRDKASAGAAGWPFISTQGSTPMMTLAGQDLGNEHGVLEAVILGGVRVNSFYVGDFDPSKPGPPSCYAIADPDWDAKEVESKLAPPADLKAKESDKCIDCRYNAFGSGRGNSKACKNSVRLAILPADAPDFSKADGMLLNVPPTSQKLWSGYVGPFAAVNRPVFSLVSTIEKVPAKKGSGFSLAFGMQGLINDPKILRALATRAEGDGLAAMIQPPPAVGEGGTRGGGKKKARRRKVVKKGRR